MKRILILAAFGLVFGATACTQQANQPAPSNTPAPATNDAAAQPKPDTPAAKAISYELKIEGMMCGNCEATVSGLLKSIEGVESAEANNKTGIAVVRMKPGFKLDEAKAHELIDKDYTLVSCAQVPAAN